MLKIKFKYLLLLLLPMFACGKEEGSNDILKIDSMYFPPVTGNLWETVSPKTLAWNDAELLALYEFLEYHHTKAFIILVDGKIAVEKYFNGHTATNTWQWNSAGKTLVAASIGISQQENLLKIEEPVSKYVGIGWTSAPNEKENLISIRNLLTMTSGLNDENNYLSVSNLSYLADAGTRWSYHNVFQRLMDVIQNASDQSFESYFDNRIASKIGMTGYWNNGLIFRIYHSNARSMARFGLLALNKGKWENMQIVNEAYFNECIQSSQSLNPSYGYFWWLNGKSSFMVPSGQGVYPGFLVPNAPANMYAAMGADDQRIYIVPDSKMVIIRLGENSGISQFNYAVSGFDAAFWEKMNLVIH